MKPLCETRRLPSTDGQKPPHRKMSNSVPFALVLKKSCNDDGLICDLTTTNKIKDILLKLDINEFQLKNIHTENVYATEVLLKEDRYLELANKLNCSN